jgi:hypothetical protein
MQKVKHKAENSKKGKKISPTVAGHRAEGLD